MPSDLRELWQELASACGIASLPDPADVGYARDLWPVHGQIAYRVPGVTSWLQRDAGVRRAS